MVQVILTDDQARSITAANAAVSLVDSAGNAIGIAQRTKLSPLEIEEIMRRAATNGPWRTTTQVLERLAGLEQSSS